MLTYELKKQPGVPLYEALYRCIRGDILSGKLRPGEKLPSKRALAGHLEVSKITVEAAYNQLLAEGYLTSREKVGYFVEAVTVPAQAPTPAAGHRDSEKAWLLDLTGGGTERFPFSVWSRLQREVMLDYGEKLLLPLPNRGVPELRQAIARHLMAFRGMAVDPENILIGAGTDFLYNLLIQLLGREKVYAVEEPGYDKIRKVYTANAVLWVSAPMDDQGVLPQALQGAQVLHISPNHHFPTGLITPVHRRKALLAWARAGENWIIEDDYDSEFRFDAHPKPALQSLGPERVIYMNSFSKTLARFLDRGYFEKHLNRMGKFYKTRRDQLVKLLENCPFAEKLTILEQDAGLHFLLRVDTPLSDEALVARLASHGIRVHALSHYYHDTPAQQHCLVVNYSNLPEEALEQALEKLTEMEV